MKENQSQKANLKNHPSLESKFKPHKPCIKVNYQVIHQTRDTTKRKEGKKMFTQKIDNNSSTLSESRSHQVVSRVKSYQGSIKQYESGKFIECQYYPNENNQLNESRNTCRKGKVMDAKFKYQHSKSVQNIIKQQYLRKKTPSNFIAESRMEKLKTERDSKTGQSSRVNTEIAPSVHRDSKLSERSKLPSYSREGIKDIIQYEHAGTYRQERIAQKCTDVRNSNQVKDKFRAFDQIHDFDFRKRVNTLSNEMRLTKGIR